jgi:hypothetical protein
MENAWSLPLMLALNSIKTDTIKATSAVTAKELKHLAYD